MSPLMPAELVAQLTDSTQAELSAGSNTVVEWRCLKDSRHTWQASPNTRKTRGCPVCSNRAILVGVNDLQTTDPDLAVQLRDPRDAAIVNRGSHRKLWWECPVDARHQWQASVTSRSRLGAGCPFCAGRLPLVGVSDLATTHPDLTRQLVTPDLATTVGAGSAKKLEWRCAINASHTWTAAVRARVGTQAASATGCPHCAGRSGRSYNRRPTLSEINSPLILEAVDPELAASLSSGSGQVLTWRCQECTIRHTYNSSVRHRLRGQGCPVRAGRTVLIGVNDLGTTHSALAAQLVDQTLMNTLTRGSEIFADWSCDQGHVWSAPVYARVAGNGCPDCSPIGSSAGEQALRDVVEALEPSAQHRAKIVTSTGRGVEVDVLADRLAVEFNGLFWHSEGGGRSRSSHADKARAIRDADYQLMTVWEDEWMNLDQRAIHVRALAYRLARPDLLLHALTIAGIPEYFDPSLVERHGARTLRLTRLDGGPAADFYRRNHIQGAVTLTATFALLDEHDQPRAVLGVRSPRHSARAKRDPGQWEIQRYATAGIIPGGFSRLLRYAATQLRVAGEHIEEWVTLSANDSSQGELYETTGFRVDGTVPPNYWYTGGPLARNQRLAKEAFQLKRFREDDRLTYEEGWSEREAATANKLLRVWDAGKTRWRIDIA